MRGGFSGTVANISTTINSHNNFINESVNFRALNENNGANYNNWIQYKKLKKCYFWCVRYDCCGYIWGDIISSSYKEVKATNNIFTKNYSN